MSKALQIIEPEEHLLPGLIGRAGKPAARRFLEFFTVKQDWTIS